MKPINPELNVVREYIFTFGVGQENAGKYVRIRGNFFTSRDKMFELYGEHWAFQYTKEEFMKYPYHETEELAYYDLSTWYYYLYENKNDGEYACVQEHTLTAANKCLAENVADPDDWRLLQTFESDDAGDAYVDSLGLDVF